MVVTPPFLEYLVHVAMVKMGIPVVHLFAGAAVVKQRIARNQVSEVDHGAGHAQIQTPRPIRSQQIERRGIGEVEIWELLRENMAGRKAIYGAIL